MGFWTGIGLFALFAAGYAAAVFTWEPVKGFFISADARIKALEAKLSDLRARL